MIESDPMTDLPRYLATAAPWPDEDFSRFGAVAEATQTKVQQLTGKFLGRNWLAIPHVTHCDDIDITALEDRRMAWNAVHPDRKLTPVPLLIKALANCLKLYPKFNQSLNSDGTKIIQKAYCHIGVAVETDRGLMVPVLRDIDEKDVFTIAAELAAVSRKAREKGLSMAEMSGGSMTLSSLGHLGGTVFTPIINAPEVAILGVTRLQERPVKGPDGALVWRKYLPLSLSYDHRVINGGDAARFCVSMGEQLDQLLAD